MEQLKQIKVIDGYYVWLKFEDGTEKVVNLRPLIGKGFTAELLAEEKFNELYIEPGGGLAWPNGFDICPNYLKEMENRNHKIQEDQN